MIIFRFNEKMKMYSPIEQFDIIIKYPIIISNTLDISINNVVWFLILSFLFIIIITSLNLTKIKIVPFKGQLVLEMVYKFISNLVLDQIGKNGLVFFPFLFTLFMFILICNLFGLAPFGFSCTSYMAITFFLSLTVWFSALFLGLSTHKLKFLKYFVPDVGWQMVVVLIIIELISYVIRAFSLAIRLSANIIAGHTLLHIIANLKLGIIKVMFCVAPIVLVLLLMIFFLEIGVAFVQSYVFLMLTSLYLNDALQGAAH